MNSPHLQSNLMAAMFFMTAIIVAVPEPAVADDAPPPPEEASAGTQSRILAGTAPFDLSDPKRIEAGKETFNATCASYCHGQNPILFQGRTDLTGEYVFNTIRDGGKGATPMPPWGEVFSREEIWELVAYLKSLGEW